MSRETHSGKGVVMVDEKRLHEDLARLLQRLRVLEQECEEKRKKYKEKDCVYLEGVYSGEQSGFFCAAEMLDTVLLCNGIKREGAEDGETRL
ncbi:hypothetical protein [Bacteroides sp. Phil13]|nr:hypothetical protein [Bacteroides sp. Phil13]